MKDAEKNEIEMLLRNLAKKQRAESIPDDAHLDPDELNAFAEGQIPPATRSLYVTHLADCDRCRKIVAQLTPAAGLQQIQTEVQKKRTAGSYLTTFFSPNVMRYAFPALAVLILGVAGFLWIKREPGREFVAQQTQPTPLSGSPSNTPVPASVAQNTSSPESNGKRSEAKPTPAKTAERDSETARNKTESTDKSAAKTGDETSTSAATPAAAKSAETYAPPPEPAKAEKQAPKDTPEGASNVAGAKSKTDEASSSSVTRTESEERGRADTSKPASRKAAPRSAINGSAAGGLMAQREEKAVTRSVGGRQFRRVENVWIDTAYEASTATTNIRRGSEQYRVLIGDEPGLRTIAEQLDGEVVVVWKGKAYRIR